MINNYEKAEKFYSSVHKDHNLYLESQKNIAINKKHQNNKKKAEEELISLIDLYPGNNNLVVSLADLYKSTKQYKRAIPYYSIVLNNQDLELGIMGEVHPKILENLIKNRSNRHPKND